MKKYMTLGIVLSLLLVPMVAAMPLWNRVTQTLEIVEKDSNWDIVEDGAHGIVIFSTVSRWQTIFSQRARVTAWDLEPKTQYTLIYYGNEQVNDVWPYATCISPSRRTSTQGYFKGNSYNLNHLEFVNDGVAQKIWLVKSSDVDCALGEFTAWNPSEYLFEMNAI